MLKREMDSLLWKINYKDIQWAKTTSDVNSVSDETDESEVSQRFFNKPTGNWQKTRQNASERDVIGSSGFASDWLGQLGFLSLLC